MIDLGVEEQRILTPEEVLQIVSKLKTRIEYCANCDAYPDTPISVFIIHKLGGMVLDMLLVLLVKVVRVGTSRKQTDNVVFESYIQCSVVNNNRTTYLGMQTNRQIFCQVEADSV